MENDDTVKVDLLNQICWNNINIDINKAKKYCTESIQLAEKLNYKKGLSKSVILMSSIFMNLGNYDKCLEYNLKGLKIREEIGDEQGAAGAYGNIGSVYTMMNQIDKALEYHIISLEKFRRLYSENPNNDDMFDIAICLLSIGDIYKSQKKYDYSMSSFSEALGLFQKLNHKPSIAASFSGIAAVFHEMNKVQQAIEYNMKALDIFIEERDKVGMSNVYLNLSNIYFKSYEYEKAIEYATKCLNSAKEISYMDNLKNSYQVLAHTYEKSGDFHKAYQYHKIYSDIKDSLLNEESSKQITEMQTKYETEKKEQQITLLNKDKELQEAQLNRQKIVIWSVVCGLAVVLMLSVFIYRERRKSEKLLLNILPAETARELKASGKAKARHYESVTVMFTDFKGFTTIAEKLSAEELVSELDHLFKKFDEIISKYNIEKIKTIGDAYMCASGIPTPNMNHAEEILKAGIEIQNWMSSQNNGWSLRMGIHTGSVTAGVVGDKKFAYDIWGDTVNTASRMESSGEPGKINISGPTQELIKDKFNCTYRGKLPAKNKEDMEMYFVEEIVEEEFIGG